MTDNNHTPQIEAPKDHRLFHYTSELDFLEDMLTNGLWPRYCVEDFSWLFGESTYIAFPMVCFCDIPITASADHRGKYGNYAISIHKNFTKELNVNPIWYIDEDSSVAEQLRASFSTHGFEALKTLQPSQKAMLPYLKSTIGSQLSRDGDLIKGIKPHETLVFEEELEWRHTPPELISTWLEDTYRQDFPDSEDFPSLKGLQTKVKELHEKSQDYRISLTSQMIDTIFVPTVDDHEAIITLLDRIYPNHNILCQVWPDVQ